MKESQRLLGDRNGKSRSNEHLSTMNTFPQEEVHPIPRDVPSKNVPSSGSIGLVNKSPSNERIVLNKNSNQRLGASLSYRGPAYMSTSAFQTMADEIERQKEHSRLSRSASVGGDMAPSALNPVLTGAKKTPKKILDGTQK